MVKFKVILYKDGNESSLGEKVSATRVNITGTDSKLFDLLQKEMVNKWNDLGLSRNKIDMFWKDEEEDLIGISNNQDLLIALQEVQCDTYTLFAVIKEKKNKGKLIIFCRRLFDKTIYNKSECNTSFKYTFY